MAGRACDVDGIAGLKMDGPEVGELGGLRSIMMLALYYALFALFPSFFVWRQMYGSDWYGLTDVHGLAGVIITTLKWLIFLCMPNTILNLLGQVRAPARRDAFLPFKRLGMRYLTSACSTPSSTSSAG
eukprot:507565-Prorocentrum_minimum.AAC.2